MFELGQRAVRCRMIDQAAIGGAIEREEETDAARQLAECNRIPNKYRDDPIAWVKRAAEGGVIEAQVAYPALASTELTPEEMVRDPKRVERYKTDSMRFLTSAASVGSVDALNELAHTYQQGMLAPADPVLSYAYMDTVARSGLTPSANRMLELWAQNLTPEQIRRATEISNQLYRECCS
jgi:TPR repeat protein